MFKNGLYKHKRALDAFIEVVKVSYVGEKYIKLKIYWWVQTKYGKAYKPFNCTSNVKIMADDYDSWYAY